MARKQKAPKKRTKEESKQQAQITKQDKDALDSVVLKELYGDSIQPAVNVKEENHDKLKPILQRIADDNQCVLMAFIAPWGGKKVAPYDTIQASIRTFEELGIDKAIVDIKTVLKERELNTKCDLILTLNSPGGYVSSSYVIAKMIRDNFSNIKVFVPQLAASGGAMLALTGNEIIMGDMSRLTPIDTQLRYKREVVSAQSYRRAIQRFERYFKDKNEFEVPYIWKAMAEKFDPIIREEWDAELMQIWEYLHGLLQKTGYSVQAISKIILELVFPFFPHSYVIDREKAKTLLIKVEPDTKYPFIWNAMKTWYSIYCLQAESKHHISYVVHNKKV